MSNPLDVSDWQFKPVTVVDIIAKLNSQRDEVMRLTAERDEALSAFAQVREEKRVAVLRLIDEKRVEVERWIKAERERDEARAIARRMKAERDEWNEKYEHLRGIFSQTPVPYIRARVLYLEEENKRIIAERDALLKRAGEAQAFRYAGEED